MAGSFQELLEDLFKPLGGVSLRRMFGGIGVFRDGIMFALVDDDVLYMKADETTSAAYQAEGSQQWVYDGMRGRTTAMPYWRLPDRLLDDSDEFTEWARAAFAVAERTKKTKPAKKAPAVKKASARKRN